MRSSIFKLFAVSSLFFILTSFVLLAGAYFFLYVTVTGLENEKIETETHELSNAYKTGGVNFLETESVEHSKIKKNTSFFVRLASPDNRTLFILAPESWKEFDIARLETISENQEAELLHISSSKEYCLEIKSTVLHDGRWLQVGISTENRGSIFDRFKKLIITLLLPLVCIGFFGGGIIAKNALRPVRRLLDAVNSIYRGEMTARVQRTYAGDELDKLAQLFNQMLEKINSLISCIKDSLDNVAHDIRTPIARLRAISEATLLQETATPDLYREALVDCIEEADRISRILNVMMDISESETGIMSLDIKRVNMSHLVAKLAEMYRYAADEKQIQILMDTTAESYAFVDENRIIQAIANVIDNAVKYTSEGGLVAIAVAADESEVCITVTDSGIGIPQDEIHRIWERLYRCDHSRSQKGMGLGLSLVKAYIQSHHGTIEVNSQLNQGTTFKIHIPTTPQTWG